MATYFCVDTRPASGIPGEVHTAKQNDLGAIRDFSVDGVLASYIYLSGVGSTAANDFVSFDNAYGTVRLTSTITKGGVAVASAAVTATTSFGWYGYVGSFTASCESSILSNAYCFAMATAGRVDDAVIKNFQVMNCVTKTAGVAAGTATVQINRPWIGTYAETV
jgi:hypothetical protein